MMGERLGLLTPEGKKKNPADFENPLYCDTINFT
jgi:hypothetical protein